ncbi:MAG: IS4 family transposase [Sphingobacteriales bacterium]|nr:IS4 family transposase [Sphingobacteriales bacterium]MBI3718695.1 IS4 family transposase [Sphingobacteriales bacterium]
MVELINSFPDFDGAFGDKRIEKRAVQALQKLTNGRQSSLRQITQSNAEQKSFYRLFNNENFSEKSIEQSLVKRCAELCKGRHLLCIQDTTEFNLSSQRGRLKPGSGVGKTSKNDVLGFMLHSSLVVDAKKGNALGYSYIKTRERKETMPDRHARNYKQLPIEQKESHKWIAATQQSQQLLQEAESLTIVADREGDIYDLLAAVDGQKMHLVIRSNFNRKISNGGKLTAHLNELVIMHEYLLSVNVDIRKGIDKRTAYMALKWTKVSVMKSGKTKNRQLAGSKEMYVVEARELNKVKGIYWRLLTTHPVTNAQEAMQIIEWYKQRWHIEQVHRLLKTEGFRIERSQLEQGWAIRKLTMLAMMATLRILQMMLAYEDEHEQPIDEVFDRDQQQCLSMMNKKLEGETDKLKNPAKANTLKWATWIIARLGGWKGYTSQRKPGPIVLQKGLVKFYHMYEGWILYQTVSKNVYTQ